MKILSLTIDGFKHTAEPATYQFDPAHTAITGDNYTGKTTILEAIVWGLLGVSLQGTDRVDNLFNPKAKRMLVSLTFEHNGQTHELTRYKTKGTPVLELDSKKATQGQIEGMFGSRDVMLSAMLPGYFIALEPKRGRELLVSLMARIPKEEVLAELDEDTRYTLAYVDLLDTNATLKNLRQDLKTAKEDNIRLAGQLDEIKTALDQEVPDEQSFDGTELQQLINQKAALETGAPELIDVAGLERELAGLRLEYERTQGRLLPMPVPPAEICGECGQQIPGHMREALMSKYTGEFQRIHQHNSAIRAEMVRITAAGTAKATELETAKVTNQGRLAGYTRPDTSGIQARIDELIQQQNTVTGNNARRSVVLANIELAREREKSTREKIGINDAAIATLGREITAVGEYAAKYAELQISQLSQHLVRASIRLFDVVKSTGELKPVFKVLFDNKEQAVLSGSERIMCGMEMAELVCKLTGMDVPMLLDNAESITRIAVPGRQLFTATVVGGKELGVA